MYTHISIAEMDKCQNLEYDGTKYHSRVDLRSSLSDESLKITKITLVFMVMRF